MTLEKSNLLFFKRTGVILSKLRRGALTVSVPYVERHSCLAKGGKETTSTWPATLMCSHTALGFLCLVGDMTERVTQLLLKDAVLLDKLSILVHKED